MKNGKKVIAIILSVMMLCGNIITPELAYAEDVFTGEEEVASDEVVTDDEVAPGEEDLVVQENEDDLVSDDIEYVEEEPLSSASYKETSDGLEAVLVYGEAVENQALAVQALGEVTDLSINQLSDIGMQDKLAQAQRRLSRKAKGSKNREKAKLEVAKIHKHIANQRKDFLHKESTKIANLYDLVCVEDLNMKAIANSSFGNGKATMDNGYGMFVGYLDYKLRERGKYLIKVDKWYPSSQLCSNCGHQNKGTKELRVKEWVCPICGSIHNRDINAAKNILSEGKRKLEQELAS